MLLLWYTVKRQRYEQDTLIKRYLITEVEVNNQPKSKLTSIFDVELPKTPETSTDPFIYKHSKCFGQPQRLFPAIFTILFLFYIVQMVSGLVHQDILSRLLIMTFMSLAVCIMIHIVTVLWCCTKKGKGRHKLSRNDNNDNDKDTNTMYVGSFKDAFKFRLELTLLLMVFCFTIPVQSVISFGFNGDYGIILAVITAMLSQTFVLLIQTILPYITYKQNVSTFNENALSKRMNNRNTKDGHKRAVSSTNTTTTLSTKKSVDSTNSNGNGNGNGKRGRGSTKTKYNNNVSLLDILRHKYGFYLFVNHLVQELSFENLSILIEIYQFKHVTVDNISGYHKKSRFKTHFHFKRSSKTKSKTKRKSKSKKKKLSQRKKNKEKAHSKDIDTDGNGDVPAAVPSFKLADIPSAQSMDFDDENVKIELATTTTEERDKHS